MRQLLLTATLTMAAWTPAHATLVYLNDIEVLDTNSNLVWLAPWVTEGLGPVNAYTQNGWRLSMGGITPIDRLISGKLDPEIDSYADAVRFFSVFLAGEPETTILNDRYDVPNTVWLYGTWPPPPEFVNPVNGRAECCTAVVNYTLYAGPDSYNPNALWYLGGHGGPVDLPASGDWPGVRMFLVRDYSVVPIPASAWLLGTGVVGLLGRSLRRRSVA